MGEHSQLIILWAANLTSQPNTARHLLAARRRGAYVVTVDVRHTEAAAKSDEVLLIRPGTDAALALAMMNVICAEQRHDAAFIEQHTVGFEELADHVQAFTPSWGARITGIAADRIVDLARRYAATRPAMIVLGGSSMHKGSNGWEAARAISCLPGLTGNVGIAGGGFGPRHGSGAHGRGFGDITEPARRAPGTATSSQMSVIASALREGQIHNLLLMGSNMLSSFSDANAIAVGLARTKLIVSYDLFLNDTARRFADVVLPSASWLEELGCKATHTHVYLMEQALGPAGETRPSRWILQELAARLQIDDYYPWQTPEALVDAVLDHASTGHATVASLRRQGGIGELRISHIANPTLDFDTPSRKIEFFSARAGGLGLPTLPTFSADDVAAGTGETSYPLLLTHGRTMTHFHSFYNNGRELPTLARREAEPELWIAPAEAAARQLADGSPIRVFNQRGSMAARAHVTDRMPPGAVWIRDGWPELNQLTGGNAVLPDHAVEIFSFSAGQASFDARVEVAAL